MGMGRPPCRTGSSSSPAARRASAPRPRGRSSAPGPRSPCSTSTARRRRRSPAPWGPGPGARGGRHRLGPARARRRRHRRPLRRDRRRARERRDRALGGVGEMEPEAFQRVIDVDLVGSWRTVRATLPAVAARQGYYLLAASLAAVAHAPLNGAYSAAKAGLVALAKTMRLELALRGVAVGIAYLPYVDTATARLAVEDPRLQALFASAPRSGPRRSPSTASPTATSAPSPPGSAGCSSTAPRWSPCTCRSSPPPWASGSCAGRWSDSTRCDEHGGARANRAVAWPRRPGGRPGRRLTAKETEKASLVIKPSCGAQGASGALS